MVLMMYAESCCKRTILVLLIVEDVVTCFLEHSVFSIISCIVRIKGCL